MKMIRFYSLLLIPFVLMLPASVLASSTILVFGDSLSAGYGIERGHEWVSLLQKRLEDTKFDYLVRNLSISGETTAGGRERLGQALAQTRPEILILALGANDGLRGIDMDVMKKNLQAMIDQALGRRIHVILVGMHLPSNYGPAYTNLFHQQFVQLSQSNPVTFIPFLLNDIGENIELFQADGIHPLASAQPQIMDTVWQAVHPLLEKGQ